MAVAIEDKVKVLDAIVADDGEGLFEDSEQPWDGTFEDLHRLCDANMYLEPILEKYGTIDALSETLEFVTKSLALLRA